ncbi:MAG UNVERIFIED_CONTAM: hypothetical protein LVR18_46150 [Planctomycetaceae bacterium]
MRLWPDWETCDGRCCDSSCLTCWAWILCRSDCRCSRLITGMVEHPEFVVERLHFQSLPGLYVTGNLYRPVQTADGPLPTVLYVCGHGQVKKDGISFGNKTHYQHHGSLVRPQWLRVPDD